MRRYNKNVWPEECQHKGREVYGAPSCRWCEFSEAPELADGGCILSNDPAFKEFMHRRREHILEFFDVSLRGMNATQRRDRARARGNIKRMLKRCTDFDTLQMLEERDHVGEDRDGGNGEEVDND